nr:MAG TPA: hypothetical protein [Caudoviricetes sp.]
MCKSIDGFFVYSLIIHLIWCNYHLLLNFLSFI